METTPQNQVEQQPIEPQEVEVKSSTYPSFVDLAAIFGVFVVVQLVVALICNMCSNLLYPQLPSSETIGYISLITQVVSMLTVMLFIKILRKRRGAESTPLSFGIKGFDPAILLGGVVMLLTTGVVLEPLLALMPPAPDIETSGWAMMLTVVVGAPIFEEIICRGMIFNSLRLRYGLLVAWVVSSLFFGLLHMHPTMVVNAFFMGLILCYFYVASGSLVAPIILHAINNAIAYLMILMGFGQGVMLRDLITAPTLYWIVYCASAVILAVSVVLSARQFKKIAGRDLE